MIRIWRRTPSSKEVSMMNSLCGGEGQWTANAVGLEVADDAVYSERGAGRALDGIGRGAGGRILWVII